MNRLSQVRQIGWDGWVDAAILLLERSSKPLAAVVHCSISGKFGSALPETKGFLATMSWSGRSLDLRLGISRLRIGARSIFFITCGRRTNYKQSCMKVTRTVTAKQQRPTRRCMFTQSTSTSSSSLYTSKQELSPTLFSSVPTDRPKGAPPSLSV
jgi:hypothetical protein